VIIISLFCIRDNYCIYLLSFWCFW